MEKQLGLSAENFSHRLNMSGFTNIEKSYSSEEFNKKFNADTYDVFEKASINNFVNDLQKKFGSEIKKGGYNDLPEVHEAIEKAKTELGKLQSIFINDGPGTERTVFVMEKAKQADDFVKGSEDELEKGKMNSFEYSNNFKFSKTGKEIKEKMMTMKAEETVKLAQIERDIDITYDACSNKPTEKPYCYGLSAKIKNPYKVFNWNQTYYSADKNGETKADSGKSIQAAATPEDAALNQKYNDLVRQWADTQVELLLMDLYVKNLDDKKSYDLSSEQMLTLNF